MKNNRIIVSVTNDITTDQRVHKVCTSLKNEGYEVLLIGRKLKNSLPLTRAYKTIRMNLLFKKSFLFYAEYNIRLFLFLLFSKCDIQLSNDTDSLIANYLSARIKGRKLVFDAHELFPESTEITYKPIVKNIWKKIENVIFPKLKNCYTVCDSIADHYKKLYNIDMKVIRNVPSKREISINTSQSELYQKITSIKNSGQKIILYQGVINMGRGLEWMIDAMKYIENATFVIIGDGDITDEIRQKIIDQEVSHKVIMLGKIEPEHLLSFTRLGDLGINLLENRGLNQYYALPNRIFDFIYAEIPVLSTDFPEIRSIINQYKTGSLTDQYDPISLSETVKKMLLEWENKPNRQEIFEKAKNENCWKNEQLTLFNIFKNLK